MEHCPVGGKNEHLNVMRTSAVRSLDGVAIRFVASRNTGVGLVANILDAANEVIFDCAECWLRRERHGSQTIAGTSRDAVNLSQHVHPKNQFSLTTGLGLSST